MLHYVPRGTRQEQRDSGHADGDVIAMEEPRGVMLPLSPFKSLV